MASNQIPLPWWEGLGEGEKRVITPTFVLPHQGGGDRFKRSPDLWSESFTGWVKDLVPLYADLDILALTSDNEGTPVAVIEALAFGVGVVATDVGGVRGLIGGCGIQNAPLEAGSFEIGKQGVLVKSGDARGFAKGLQYLLDHPGLCKEMGQRGREYALKHHSEDRLIADMNRLYRSLLR